MDESLQYIEEDIIDEIKEEMPDLAMPRRLTLVNVLDKVYAKYKVPLFSLSMNGTVYFVNIKTMQMRRETISFFCVTFLRIKAMLLLLT